MPPLVALLKDRATSIHELVTSTLVFFQDIKINEEDRARFLTPEIKPALDSFTNALREVDWERSAIGGCIKLTLKEFEIKMPQLAMPLRLLLTGQTQTPAIDAVIELVGRERVLSRLETGLSSI